MFAERCPLCHGPSEQGYCRGCRGDFARILDPCPGCALPRPVTRCPRDADWQLERLCAPFAYMGLAKGQLIKLKYHGGRKLARALALLTLDELGSGEVDALVAVPLHRQRLRERGYNQAHELARSLAGKLGVPLLTRGIVRHRYTRPQTALDARHRAGNLAGAFRVTRLPAQRIAIVDDVVTTGATLNGLAAALSEAGAAYIEAWCVARAL